MPISEEEAKAEVASIEADIAKEKGEIPAVVPPSNGNGEEGKDAPAPAGDEPATEPDKPKEDAPKGEDKPVDKPADTPPPTEPDRPRKPRTLLAKLQDTKHKSAEAIAQKDAEINRLNDEINKLKSTSAVDAKIKSYAEKHGLSEEQVRDMVDLLGVNGQQSALDKDSKDVIEKSKVIVAKQEADEAFDEEFADLLTDTPNAAQHKEQLKKLAHTEGNLSKSLYEIYNRQLLPKLTTPPAKKGADSARGGDGRSNATTFDVKKVAENVRTGKAGALEGLSGEQQDEVFAYMEKTGSRYT